MSLQLLKLYGPGFRWVGVLIFYLHLRPFFELFLDFFNDPFIHSFVMQLCIV